MDPNGPGPSAAEPQPAAAPQPPAPAWAAGAPPSCAAPSLAIPTRPNTSALSAPFMTPASSPGALLAASLVRSRATYFERLSSNSRASTSGGGHQGCGGGALPPPLGAAQPLSRHNSITLASHPLHPLAPHPLSTVNRTGSEEPRAVGDVDMDGSESDVDSESIDTFFDKPSYTRYGSNVELSAATSYRTLAPAGSGSSTGQASGAAAACDQDTSSSTTGGDQAGPSNPNPAVPAAPPDGVAVCASGYVRSMSGRFGSVTGGSAGRGAAGMDGLFDDLVMHVGALLASHPDVEAQMGMVQGLSDKLLELHSLCETLGRKEDEVEHLRGVLRELTTTRAEAIRLKVQMAESLNGLQLEYYKVLRSAQLAQGTCKQHSARAAATRKQLAETQNELARYKRAVATLRERNRRLRADNEDMAARLGVLEQAQMSSDPRHSACYISLLQSQAPILY